MKKIREILGKYKIVSNILLILFPVILVLITELNQMQSITALISFIFSRPSVLLFDILFTAGIFAILLLIFKHGYISSIILGVIYYTLSCVEYFKFKASGTHFVLNDLFMVGNAGDVAKFADIELSFLLVLNVLLILLYPLALYLFDSTINIKLKPRLISIFSGVLCVVFFFVIPSFSHPVFHVFNVATTETSNAFSSNSNFNQNNMIAYLVQTTVNKVERSLKKPNGYSQDSIHAMLNKAEIQKSELSQKPDVIYILSESYGDFRKIKNSGVKDSYYTNFDKMAQEGYRGECIVPTFGGYTTRTEFELLMGLPVKSLNNAELPHKLLKDRMQLAIPSYYKSNGYKTTYIHPFSNSFYDRNEIYPNYGFDQMIFEDKFKDSSNKYRAYISDEAVFNQIKEQLSKTSEPNYIFTTTMQNHQPYIDSDKKLTELEYYMQGIQETDRALGEFLTYLKTYNRPVVVVFLGDHYPFFSSTKNAYTNASISEKNCETLYRKEYVLWSNRNIDYSKIQNDAISTFYIPYLVSDLISLPQSQFNSVMLNKLKQLPIYSENITTVKEPDPMLDNLTYDRVVGKQYSSYENNDE